MHTDPTPVLAVLLAGVPLTVLAFSAAGRSKPPGTHGRSLLAFEHGGRPARADAAPALCPAP